MCKNVKIEILTLFQGKILEDPRAELIALYLCLHLRLQLVKSQVIKGGKVTRDFSRGTANDTRHTE